MKGGPFTRREKVVMLWLGACVVLGVVVGQVLFAPDRSDPRPVVLVTTTTTPTRSTYPHVPASVGG